MVSYSIQVILACDDNTNNSQNDQHCKGGQPFHDQNIHVKTSFYCLFTYIFA